jgi:hypothetical protein
MKIDEMHEGYCERVMVMKPKGFFKYKGMWMQGSWCMQMGNP